MVSTGGKNSPTNGGGGNGGGKVEVPASVMVRNMVRKPGQKFSKPVDRAALAEETAKRIAEAKENVGIIHEIGAWLVDIFSASVSQAERDQYEKEIAAYTSDLDVATRDSNPAIRRAGAYELLRWMLSYVFATWEQVGQVVADLVKKEILVSTTDFQKFLIRVGQDGYMPNPAFGFEQAQLDVAKSWVIRIVDDIRDHTCREWALAIQGMENRSCITLDEMVQGNKVGLCHVVVPDNPNYKRDGKLYPLEGGHLLVEVLDGGKVVVKAVAGDPVTGKGSAFVKRMQEVMELKPGVFIPAYMFKLPSVWPKPKPGEELSEGQERAKAFFEANPKHASARTVFHAAIKRAIVLASRMGDFKNTARVLYLGDRRSQKPTVRPQESKPAKEKKSRKKGPASRKDETSHIAAASGQGEVASDPVEQPAGVSKGTES